MTTPQSAPTEVAAQHPKYSDEQWERISSAINCNDCLLRAHLDHLAEEYIISVDIRRTELAPGEQKKRMETVARLCREITVALSDWQVRAELEMRLGRKLEMPPRITDDGLELTDHVAGFLEQVSNVFDAAAGMPMQRACSRRPPAEDAKWARNNWWSALIEVYVTRTGRSVSTSYNNGPSGPLVTFILACSRPFIPGASAHEVRGFVRKWRTTRNGELRF